MGAWGAAIADNDDVLDLQGDFENLIDGGGTVEEATRQILLRYELTTADDDVDNHDFWLGLALMQYRAGTMTRDVHTKALEITESAEELDRWFGDSREARAAVLGDFRQQLRSFPDTAISASAPAGRGVPWWTKIFLAVLVAVALFLILRTSIPGSPVFATWPFLLAAAYTGRIIRGRFIARDTRK